jgi:hypothetical protein
MPHRPAQIATISATDIVRSVVEVVVWPAPSWVTHDDESHHVDRADPVPEYVDRPYPGTNNAVVGVMGPTGGPVHDLDHRANRVTGGHEHPGTHQFAE